MKKNDTWVTAEAFIKYVNWRTTLKPASASSTKLFGSSDDSSEGLPEDIIYLQPNTNNIEGVRIGLGSFLSTSFSNNSSVDFGILNKSIGKTSSLKEFGFMFEYGFFYVDYHQLRIKGMDMIGSIGTAKVAPVGGPSGESGFRDDINVRNQDISALINFNYKKYSPNAVFNFQGRQLKTAGAFLIGAFFNKIDLDSENGLIPEFEQADFGEDAFIINGTFRSHGLALGVGGVAVQFKKLNFGGQVLAGIGKQQVDYILTGEQKSTTGTNYYTDFKFAANWNAKYFFMGIFLNYTGLRYKTNSISVSSSVTEIKTSLGFRL